MTRTSTKRVIFVATVACVALLSGVANAATNPFKCSLGSNKTVCAQANSKQAARQYLGRLFEHGQELWPGGLNCTPASPRLLVWRCAATTPIPNGWTGVLVTWKATSRGWTVRESLYK